MKTIPKFILAILTFAAASMAMAFPTTVRLTANPQFVNEGQEVVIRTNKGSVTASTGPEGNQIYQAFTQKGAVKGACFILETERETDVEFNLKTDKSGASSAKKVNCTSAKR
ncbi:MAG: hypothetical protein PSV40_10345 [Polaromonas sp.]|uniref:hypothetical protein n=1 Tax=Polaromonas sp. TaxID=1869339 RepID=UPI00248A8985|nr:hypothetical protein [Polaromonas sp.]MDI1269482.1 hypothetical protein [Polaromonas sp.]